MDDRQRLAQVREQLGRLKGLDDERFQRLTSLLDAMTGNDGCDDQGRLKVTVFDAKSYDTEFLNQANRERFALRYVRAALNRDTAQAAEGSKVICIFVNDMCDAPLVATLASLGVELIALRCAGFNHVDLAACAQHGISVVRVPAYSPHAVAEHTVALMLTLNRHLYQAYQRNRMGYFVLEGLTGFDMRGKTVGVIGTGQIGRCTIEILLGFGCQILAYDMHRDRELAQREGVRYVELATLIANSDIITLHIPLFPETKYIIDQAAIARMRRGVMLINTSRGGLVDTKALIQGLKTGQVGFAGLDVYEEESGVFFHDWSDQVLTDDTLARLMTFNNVVITSHQAFLTREALTNIADTTIANVAEFAAGRRGLQLTHAVPAP